MSQKKSLNDETFFYFSSFVINIHPRSKDNLRL